MNPLLNEPQDVLKRGHGGPGVRDVLFREMVQNPVPLMIAQPQHARTYRDRCLDR